MSAQVLQGGDGRLVVNLGQEAGVSYLPERISDKLYRRQVEGARVPGVDAIRSDLALIAAPIPAQVVWGTQGRTDRLRLYINGRYVLVLEVAKNGRSYFLTDVRPLGLRDQDQIVRCEFALTAQSWQLYDHPGDVPDASTPIGPPSRRHGKRVPTTARSAGRRALCHGSTASTSTASTWSSGRAARSS